MERIPYWIRVSFIALTASGSFLIVRFAPNLWLALCGLGLCWVFLLGRDYFSFD